MELVNFGIPAFALLSSGSVVTAWGHKDYDWSTTRIGLILLVLGLLVVIAAGVYWEPPAGND